jgi:hypothetical protein
MTEQSATDLVAERIVPVELTEELFQQMASRIARLEWLLSNMTGAAAAVLHSIDKAGGYQVFDAHHQEPIHRAFNALAHSVGERLEQTGTQRRMYGLPSVGHPTLIG